MVKSLFSIFQDSLNSFEGQEPAEKVVLLTRQHPFFIIIRIGLFVFACLLPIAILIVFWSYLHGKVWMDFFLFISSIWYMGFWLAIFRSLTIYTLNTVIVTDRRIIESDQYGFFNRKISELHNQRIQDVTTHTNGIIETFLEFGNVMVQTAASEKQFIFYHIPCPEKVKDAIMQTVLSRHSGVKPVR